VLAGLAAAHLRRAPLAGQAQKERAVAVAVEILLAPVVQTAVQGPHFQAVPVVVVKVWPVAGLPEAVTAGRVAKAATGRDRTHPVAVAVAATPQVLAAHQQAAVIPAMRGPMARAAR
jgi:hypothetical protein